MTELWWAPALRQGQGLELSGSIVTVRQAGLYLVYSQVGPCSHARALVHAPSCTPPFTISLLPRCCSTTPRSPWGRCSGVCPPGAGARDRSCCAASRACPGSGSRPTTAATAEVGGASRRGLGRGHLRLLGRGPGPTLRLRPFSPRRCFPPAAGGGAAPGRAPGQRLPGPHPPRHLPGPGAALEGPGRPGSAPQKGARASPRETVGPRRPEPAATSGKGPRHPGGGAETGKAPGVRDAAWTRGEKGPRRPGQVGAGGVATTRARQRAPIPPRSNKGITPEISVRPEAPCRRSNGGGPGRLGSTSGGGVTKGVGGGGRREPGVPQALGLRVRGTGWAGPEAY